MAKLPTLTELLRDPAQRARLTPPQLMQVLAQVRDLKQQLEVGQRDPWAAGPAAMAAHFSRGRWEHAPHLTLLNGRALELDTGRLPRVLVSMPPRHGKSELMSVWTPFWLLVRNPERRIILASYEATFAAKWGRRVRDLVIQHGKELGLVLSGAKIPAADNWELQSGGGMMTAGVGGPLTGKGADILIIDDAVKNDEEASSGVYRDKTWDWFQSTAFTRLEPGGMVVIIGTRWHQDDLIGRLDLFSQTGEGLEWDVVKLPALAEAGDILGRELGEALWAKRYDERKLAEIKKSLGPYAFGALYQQNPTPEEGGAIKRAWWKFYMTPPAEFDQVIQSWDLSFKDIKKADYTVGQVWGRRGAEFWLLHQTRGRMDAPEMIAALRNLWRLYPKGVAKLVEDKANGPALIALLSKEVPGIIPVKVQASKDARLSAAVPPIAAGNVYLPAPERAPWVTELVEECAAFPNGTYDDQVDALSQAINFMLPGGWASIGRSWREAKLGPPPKDFIEQQNRELHTGLRKRMQMQELQRRHDTLVKPARMLGGW